MDVGRAPPEREEQSQRVVGELIALIEQRQYAPGERLPSERDLAERFSVGRGVIREALTTLETMRYLERRPNSGVFLCERPSETSLETLVLFTDLGRNLDASILNQCMEVRRLIEVQAIKLACARRTEADLQALGAILSEFERRLEAGEDVGDLDYEFHMRLLMATHNDILVRLVNPFYIMSRNRRAKFFSSPQRSKTSHTQHAALVKSVADRNERDAERIMSMHIGRVEKYFLGGGDDAGDGIAESPAAKADLAV